MQSQEDLEQSQPSDQDEEQEVNNVPIGDGEKLSESESRALREKRMSRDPRPSKPE